MSNGVAISCWNSASTRQAITILGRKTSKPETFGPSIAVLRSISISLSVEPWPIWFWLERMLACEQLPDS